ncbi:MAG: DUF1858 domain-containing protein [Chloroflexi bacterium]|nr:DUF1858 domain-containing protein [Chloroflexota bacterium]
MVISDVVRRHPRATGVFVRHGMGCLGCMGALDETIEGGAKMHGLSVDKLLNELNDAISSEEEAA